MSLTSENQVESSTDQAVLVVDDAQLVPLQGRPPLHTYLKQLWERRTFISSYARSTAFGAGRDTFLGRAWMILDPVLQVSVYAVIFGLVLKVDRGMENFLGFLVIGVVYFQFLSRGITTGSGLIQKARPLISSFSFPRVAVPIAATLRNAMDNALPAFVAVAVALLFQLDHMPSWTVSLVPIFFLLIHFFAAGATMITARLTAFIPDMKSVISVFVRGLFFISGVFFSLDRFADGSVLQDIMKLNPVYQFLTAIRLCVLDGVVPPVSVWGYLLGWSLALFGFGLIFFWQAEGRYSHVK